MAGFNPLQLQLGLQPNAQGGSFMSFPTVQPPSGMPGSAPVPFMPGWHPSVQAAQAANMGAAQPASAAQVPGPSGPPMHTWTINSTPLQASPLQAMLAGQNLYAQNPNAGLPQTLPQVSPPATGIQWAPNTGGINGILAALNARSGATAGNPENLSPLQRILALAAMYGIGSALAGANRISIPMYGTRGVGPSAGMFR